MPSNKRRSHIHIIRQYKSENLEYTGSRIVFFIKEKGIKYIMDIDNFYVHQYYKPKKKKYSTSKWKKSLCNIPQVIKKQMKNESLCKKYKMIHFLYESETKNIEEFLEEVLKEEKILLSKEDIKKIKKKIKK